MFESSLQDDVLMQLAKMKGWHNLIGILMLIGAVFLGLGVLFVTFAAFTGPRGSGAMLCVAPIYAVMAAIYFKLGSALTASSRHINRALVGDDDMVEFNITQSLSEQADFWNITGILTVISLALNGLAILFMCVAGSF